MAHVSQSWLLSTALDKLEDSLEPPLTDSHWAIKRVTKTASCTLPHELTTQWSGMTHELSGGYDDSHVVTEIITHARRT